MIMLFVITPVMLNIRGVKSQLQNGWPVKAYFWLLICTVNRICGHPPQSGNKVGPGSSSVFFYQF